MEKAKKELMSERTAGILVLAIIDIMVMIAVCIIPTILLGLKLFPVFCSLALLICAIFNLATIISFRKPKGNKMEKNN